MAAQKTTKTSRANTFFTKGLFIFIAIMGLVAIVTYILTYNAITAKLDQQIGTDTSLYETVQIEESN